MTRVNCKHWIDIGNRNGGRCAIRAIGHPTIADPRLSFGICATVCKSRAPIDPAADALFSASLAPPPTPPPTGVTLTVNGRPPRTPLEIEGVRLWAEIHRRPLAYQGDVRAELAYIRGLGARLPSYGCSCRSHYAEMLRASPPDLSSAGAYARWWWARHNEVNARLRKPEMTWEEAAARYGYANPPNR